MELFVIRHGQSANNLLGDLDDVSKVRKRDKDPPLTDIGERQAEMVAKFLAAGRHLESAERTADRPYFDHLYCSPMLRSLQTVKPIAREMGITPEVWIDIHEVGGIYLDHGEGQGVLGYPGQTRQQIMDRFPGYILPEEFGEAGWWGRDKEEVHSSQGRAIGVANALRDRAREHHRIGAVSHGGFINYLLKAIGFHLPNPGLRYEHYNTSITRLDFHPEDVVTIRHTNRVVHLNEDVIT